MDDIKIDIIIAQIINFGILVFIFYHFLGAKITKAIEERRKMLIATQNAEEEAKARLEEAEEERQQILAEARVRASEIEKNAEEIAKQNREKMLEKSQKEAEYMINAARNQIEKEQLDMENTMKDKVMNLAFKLNAKIFKKPESNKDFIAKEYELLNK